MLSPTYSSSSSSSAKNSCSAGANKSLVVQRFETSWQLAENAATAMPVILENGRKVFGPPHNFQGKRPSAACELYIKGVPAQLNEIKFLTWLSRIGTVYEFRLMMDSCSETRGYGFVRYTQESATLTAYELLHFFYNNGERLNVYRSEGKNRLFITSIPKEMPVCALEEGFKKTFPEMESCIAYAPKELSSFEKNRGYAFIEFCDHEKALCAKKRTTPGLLRMWGCDLKVQWAKPRIENLFAPNKHSMNNSCNMSENINDCSSKLRLYCLANNWCIPVVLYGDCFAQHGIQYGGILLKNPTTGECSLITMEISVANVYDTHLMMCEVVLEILKHDHGMLRHHYVVRIQNYYTAEIVYFYDGILTLEEQLDPQICIYIGSTLSVYALIQSMQILAQHSSEVIVASYKNSFRCPAYELPTMTLSAAYASATFYSIYPKFRNNKKLNNNLNDTEIVLLQSNYSCNFNANAVWHLNKEHTMLRLKSQSRNFHPGYILKYVDVTQLCWRSFYHPMQRINSNPIWVMGHSYEQSIFQLY